MFYSVGIIILKMSFYRTIYSIYTLRQDFFFILFVSKWEKILLEKISLKDIPWDFGRSLVRMKNPTILLLNILIYSLVVSNWSIVHVDVDMGMSLQKIPPEYWNCFNTSHTEREAESPDLVVSGPKCRTVYNYKFDRILF